MKQLFTKYLFALLFLVGLFLFQLPSVVSAHAPVYRGRVYLPDHVTPAAGVTIYMLRSLTYADGCDEGVCQTVCLPPSTGSDAGQVANATRRWNDFLGTGNTSFLQCTDSSSGNFVTAITDGSGFYSFQDNCGAGNGDYCSGFGCNERSIFFFAHPGPGSTSPGYIELYSIAQDAADQNVGDFIYTPPSYTLTTSPTGTGTGTITPSSGSYYTGTQISVTATETNGSTFTGWSGNCNGLTNPFSLTMDSDKNCTASFTAPPALSVSCSVNPTTVEINDPVTWTAIASGGTGTYAYLWGGSLNSTANPVTLGYGTLGVKTGNVRVTTTGGQDSGIVACTNSVTVNAASPAFINTTNGDVHSNGIITAPGGQ